MCRSVITIDLVKSLRHGWRSFRGRSLLTQATAWFVFAVLFAVIGLTLEKDPVKQSNARLADYERTHHIQSAVQGAAPAGGKGAPEESGSAPVQVGQEGADQQLAAGATPTEVSSKVPKDFKATSGGVRALFNTTLGGRGRAGLLHNELIAVSCAGGTCKITYRPDGPGVGRVIETQGPLWTALLTDPSFKTATVTALPAKHGNGKPRKGPNVVITCTREAITKVGKWGVQATPKIRRFCTVKS
jgi:hypothetical protein